MATVVDVLSGVPREIETGVWVGATDFREFPIDLVVNIDTLTAYAATAYDGEIAEDLIVRPEEGKFLTRSCQCSLHGIAIDSFDGIFQFGEILVRQFVDDLTGGGFKEKGGIGIFTSTQDGGVEDYLKVVLALFNNVLRYSVGKGPLAQAVRVSPDTFPPTVNKNNYYWFRQRFTDVGGGESNIKLRHTFLTDGPGGVGTPEVYPPDPDADGWHINEDSTVGVPQPLPSAPTHLGFMHSTIGPQAFSTRAISFFGFTTEPETYAIPVIVDAIQSQGTQGCGNC